MQGIQPLFVWTIISNETQEITDRHPDKNIYFGE